MEIMSNLVDKVVELAQENERLKFEIAHLACKVFELQNQLEKQKDDAQKSE